MQQLLKLAQSVMREERWKEAIRLLKENSSEVETHWELSWNLGWCYFKLGRMGEARKYLARAAKLAPENHACKFGLGQVYLKTKQYKKAELILSEALRLKETHAARIGLALAISRKGGLRRPRKPTSMVSGSNQERVKDTIVRGISFRRRVRS